jgi:hypothetical protein
MVRVGSSTHSYDVSDSLRCGRAMAVVQVEAYKNEYGKVRVSILRQHILSLIMLI